MTPLQVEFCYQVAHGNVKQAQVLLPQMIGTDSLFEGTRTPAVFCLWAAKQPDPQLVLAKLAELYPTISDPVVSPTHQRLSIEETVCEVLVPAIRPHMHRLFSSIVNATPQKIRADYAKAGFEIISCAAALQFILSHQAFKDNAENWKKLTTQMLQQLLALTKEQLEMTERESSHTAHAAPDSVKALLKQTTPPSARFSTLFPGLGNKRA